MPDFLGRSKVYLQPETKLLPLSFRFGSCTTPTANDGSLPWGDRILSAVAHLYDSGYTDHPSAINGCSVSDNVVSVSLSYWSGASSGLYTLTVVVTCVSGYVEEFDLKRVYVGQK